MACSVLFSYGQGRENKCKFDIKICSGLDCRRGLEEFVDKDPRTTLGKLRLLINDGHSSIHLCFFL